jgi:hypothetical protein
MENEFAPCPKCQSTDARKVPYTWWGGALGPRLFNQVKCNNCGASYNGKTGKSNTTNIIIYTVVILVLCFIIYAVIGNL